MSGNKMGSLKRKLGLKGATKPGEMISRMNSMKAGAASGVGRLEKAEKYKMNGIKCKTTSGKSSLLKDTIAGIPKAAANLASGAGKIVGGAGLGIYGGRMGSQIGRQMIGEGARQISTPYSGLKNKKKGMKHGK